MNRGRRGLRRAALPLAACLAIAALAPPAVAADGIAVYQHESEKAFEAQLASGQIKAATINKKVRTVRLTLNDGRHMLAKYPAHQEQRVAAELEAKGVPVAVLGKAHGEKAKSKPVHHKLRYIAAGILVAVIVVVGAVLLVNRRLQRAERQPTGQTGDDAS
jgi:hypothetical protein